MAETPSRCVSSASKTVEAVDSDLDEISNDGVMWSSHKVQHTWELNSSKAASMFMVMFAFQVSCLCLSLDTKLPCTMCHTFLKCTLFSLSSFSFFMVYERVL